MGSAREQGEHWGARASDWAVCNEPAWLDLFAAVLEHAGVAPGSRHLDLGCGAGGALLVARGRGAAVSGLDASENLVAIAKLKVPGAAIMAGEMEELPFADASFDVVTGINSFQFAGNVARALAEGARVIAPGGRLAMLVWGERDRCDLIRAVLPSIFALLPKPEAAPPPPPAFAERGVIEPLMARAGLGEFKSFEIDHPLRFPDLDTAVCACMSASARVIRHAGEEAVRQALVAALAPFLGEGRAVVLQNRFHLVIGRKLA